MTTGMRGRVIGHRGAPSHRPENTVDSFRLACRMGADALETDLQMSKDGVLVLTHDTELSRTTDVASHPEFADRRMIRLVDDRLLVGWFVDDFTLEELRTLNGAGDRIATLDELLLLVSEESRHAGRQIGLHLEFKHPAYFDSVGLPMAELALSTLRDHGLDRRGSGVWLQSFDDRFVRRLSPLTELPLVQLVELVQLTGLTEMATYADAVGPERGLVLGGDRSDTGLLAEAHRRGLQVFVWTLRGDARQARRFLDAGVDGVFSDDPGVALRARRMLAPA